MAATTTLLGLVTPTQGTLSGTWGDTVNYGISDYVDISVAGTLTLTNDGAVTLANTTGSSSGNSITSSLTGAGTVTAQFAIVKVTGTLTVAKVVTGPSYSKTYTVVNAATGGIVTFKASGQTGVSIAVGETAFVYFNGTDYVKIVGTATAGAAGGSNTQVQFNSSGVLAGSANMTFDGTNLTLPALTASQAVFTNASDQLVSNAITGTGNVVMSASPTLTGTITAAAITASSTITGNGNWVLGNADTDTITQGASYVTGTVLRSAKVDTNTLNLAAYDVDGAAYTNLITLTASNTPTLALTSTGVGTINNMSIGATTTSTGAFTTLSATGNVTLGDADTDTITQAASYVTGTQLKSAKVATNTLTLAAYDVDGAAYTNLITLTASNTPTLALTSTGTGTINNMSIGATTASTGAFTTLASNGATTFTAGTASTTTGTGTLVITGGLGVSGRINAANFDGVVGANTAAAGTFTTLGATGNVTLGDASADTVTVNGTTTFNASPIISVTDNTNAALRITQLGTGNALLVEDTTNPDSTPFVIENTGRVIVGNTTALTTISGILPAFQVVGDDINRSAIGSFNYSNTANGSFLTFSKSRSGTIGTETIVQSGDNLMTLRAYGSDGVAPIEAAQIRAEVDGTPGVNDMPGRLTFSTTADGASSLTERIRITSAGKTGFATAAPASTVHVAGDTILSNVNVIGASYDSVSFSVTSQETQPTALFFSPDGLKMYVAGSSGDDVNEYNLSTAWVVSSAVFSLVFSVSGQDTSPQGLFFRADGTKMYVLGQTNDTVFQYTLSTPWSVATASYDSISFSVATQDLTSVGLWFKPNGLSMYVVGSTGDAVYQYTLSTAWNVSTATFLQSFSISGQDTVSSGINFTGDGSRMFVLGTTGDDVNVYNLTTPWDISTSAFVNVFSVAGQDTAPNDIYIKPDGTKMYIVGSTNDSVYQYTVPSIDIQLTGQTSVAALDVQQNLNVYGNASVYSAAFNSYTEGIFAVTGTTPALSPTNATIQTWTLSGNSTPTAGIWANGQSLTLMVDDGTAYTITWTSLAVTWKTNGGTAPTLNTTGYTVIQLWKVGGVIYGARVGDA